MAPDPRRLRIAFVIDIFDGVKTGGVISAQRFVAGLRERHDVEVITTGPAGPGRTELPALHPPIFRKLMREMGFVFARPRRQVLEAAFRRADLVHVQFPFLLGMRAAALARRMGKPLVAGFHVQPENMLRNVGLPSEGALVEGLYRLFCARLFDLADAVVCPSAFARDELVRRGLRVPAEVVSNGIDPRFTPGPAPEVAETGGEVLVLSVGRLAREKRHDVLIEGIRRSRHAGRVRLVVTGRGPEEARVRALAATLPLPAQVTFVTDDELLRLLRAADLLVHASEVELEGMAVLEAMGCGTPALVADAPASASPSLAAGPDFLFRPGDAGDLAAKLDHLLDDPAALPAARARCLERAPAFALSACVAKLEALYLRVASGEGVSPPSAARAGRSRAPPAGR